MTERERPEADARREPRTKVSQRTSARVALTIELLDISRNGVRASISVPLPVGTLIKVGLPNGESRHARIMWQDGTTNGCEFLKPLTAAEMASVVDH